MAATRTFSIIKPDATRRNLTGAVTKMLEDAGLRVVASKRIRMTREQAEGFYGVHRERPFFNDLCSFMTSEPVGEQADVAVLRVAGADGLRGAVAERDVEQPAGLTAGLSPVVGVRARAEGDLAELEGPDGGEDEDGGEQGGCDWVPPDPCGHRGPPASPCPGPEQRNGDVPGLGRRPAVGARAWGLQVLE